MKFGVFSVMSWFDVFETGYGRVTLNLIPVPQFPDYWDNNHETTYLAPSCSFKDFLIPCPEYEMGKKQIPSRNSD